MTQILDDSKSESPPSVIPASANRCRDVSGDSISTREPVLKGKLECCVMAVQRMRRLG